MIAVMRTQTRCQRALVLRNLVLDWLRENGRDEVVDGLRVRTAAVGEFLILFRTPFCGAPPMKGRRGYEAAVLEQHGCFSHPYSLDVWSRRQKVMNVGWHHNGALDLVGFRGGEWETKLITLCTSAT